MNANRKAFLDMIAFSEGTSTIKASDNGYNVIVGGTLFKTVLINKKPVPDYSNHPHQLIHVNAHLDSTCAGRYQLKARYYDFYRKLLGLPDFGHDSQDAIALQQIKECKALQDIDEGRFAIAVAKCARIWASFPGANYGQHENKLTDLQTAYVNYGGTLA